MKIMNKNKNLNNNNKEIIITKIDQEQIIIEIEMIITKEEIIINQIINKNRKIMNKENNNKIIKKENLNQEVIKE